MHISSFAYVIISFTWEWLWDSIVESLRLILENDTIVIPLRYRRVFIDKGYRRHSWYHMVASLLDTKSPARGNPKRNPEEWSSRGLPRTIESARFTTSQTYLNVRTARVSKGTRSRTIAARDEQSNGPKYRLVR
jgi:hypothetical protein